MLKHFQPTRTFEGGEEDSDLECQHTYYGQHKCEHSQQFQNGGVCVGGTMQWARNAW